MAACEQQCGAVATVYALDPYPGGWGGRYCIPCAKALKFMVVDRLKQRMTPSRYYILEHPTKGVLRDLEWNDAGTKQGRFSFTGMRGDESCMKFATAYGAHQARLKLPTTVAMRTQIRSNQPTGYDQFADHWPVVEL